MRTFFISMSQFPRVANEANLLRIMYARRQTIYASHLKSGHVLDHRRPILQGRGSGAHRIVRRRDSSVNDGGKYQ